MTVRLHLVTIRGINRDHKVTFSESRTLTVTIILHLVTVRDIDRDHKITFGHGLLHDRD